MDGGSRKNNKFTLEICVDNVDSALAAIKGGADRLEVCSALALGGLTPSISLLEDIWGYIERNQLDVSIATMIRPRPGDFIYSPNEISQMGSEMLVFNHLSDSFVFGCLNFSDDGEICVDSQNCEYLIETVKPKPVTFHRAFDLCTDLEITCSKLIKLGFKRILTSGGQPTALIGVDKIKQLQTLYGSDIAIMAGSGVRADNIRQLYEVSRVLEFHSSASKETVSQIKMACERVFPSGVAKWQVTSKDLVSELVKIISDFEKK